MVCIPQKDIDVLALFDINSYILPRRAIEDRLIGSNNIVAAKIDDL
jgi:hypothetical protein